MSSPNPVVDAEGDSQSALFAGDTGHLELETRRVLVQLLAGPSIDGRRHGKLWATLLRDEIAIRTRLSELFLALVIDHEQQVAFTRQAETEGLEIPILLRRAPLSFIDSVLLMHLREVLSRADAQGERAAISEDEMREFVGLYEKKGNTDHAAFAKRAENSIEKLKKFSILQRSRSAEDRYEISPTLKLLFTPEEIVELTTLYKSMAEPTQTSREGRDEDR